MTDRHPPRTVAGHTVAAVGFGAMPLSTAGRPDRNSALAVLGAVLDAGVGLVDTADAYCLGAADTGHNEELVAEALRRSGRGHDVLVAMKGGHVRGDDGSWAVDASPQHLRAACDASLVRLGVDAIGLYQLHRPDPRVPFLDSVGALAGLVSEGKVLAVGLSNVTRNEIDAARRVLDVAAVQNRFGPDFRTSAGELRHCGELGIPFLTWAPLGGAGDAGRLGELHPAFAVVAARRGVSPQRVALAWALAQGPTVLPIPGARRRETALDSLAAAALVLDAEELALLDGDEVAPSR